MRHLAQIGRDLADVFTFRQIGAGDDHHEEIKTSLDRSEIGILLISADFLASEYVAGVELPALIEGDKRLFAVVVGQCDHEHLTSNLYAPWGLTPLKTMTEPERDEVYTEVARELRRALGS